MRAPGWLVAGHDMVLHLHVQWSASGNMWYACGYHAPPRTQQSTSEDAYMAGAPSSKATGWLVAGHDMVMHLPVPWSASGKMRSACGQHAPPTTQQSTAEHADMACASQQKGDSVVVAGQTAARAWVGPRKLQGLPHTQL